MKQEAFKEYTKKVSNLFSISEKDVFTKTKRRVVVDARHLLYYLCFQRPMQIKYIQRYMSEQGYEIGHSSIIHGKNQVAQKVEDDEDYLKITKQLA